VRWADEYNTVFPTVAEARAQAGLDEAAREAGRDPLRYSMMIGCVVGRTDAEVKTPRTRSGQTPDRRHGGGGRRAAARVRTVGVERAMLQHLAHDDVDMIAVLGEVAAHLG
jgi:hypothetical protein